MGYRILNWSLIVLVIGCGLLGLNPESQPAWLADAIGHVPYVLVGVNFAIFFVAMIWQTKAAKGLTIAERQKALREHWGVAYHLFLAMFVTSLGGLLLFKSSINSVLEHTSYDPQVSSVIFGLQWLYLSMMFSLLFIWMVASKRIFAATKMSGQ